MAKARVTPRPIDGNVKAFEGLQYLGAMEAQRREVNTQPFADGLWIRDIAIAATSTKQVQHNLRRVPSGYIITKSLNGDGVYQTASNADSITFRNPTASAVTIDVWVF